MRIPYYLIVLAEMFGAISLCELWRIWYRYRQEVKEVEDEKHEHVFNDVAFSSWKEHLGGEWTLIQVVYCECGLTREERFDSWTFRAIEILKKEDEL